MGKPTLAECRKERKNTVASIFSEGLKGLKKQWKRLKRHLKKQTKAEDRYLNLDDLRKNILRGFQCKTYLNAVGINALLKSAGRKDLHFSAQVAQDIIAYLFFKGKTCGFYVDIGANDGINGSTTFWAEQIGWNGICVEPQKSTFERMKTVRTCALYNCAVSNKSRENVAFISFPNKDTRSGLADSMSESHIEAAKQFSNMENNLVSTKTFGDIMADFPKIEFIDFLSIDTEGHEMQVLESIDFTKFKFGLITIETEDGSDVVRYVESNGYKKLMIAGSDCLFVPKDYDIPVSCAIDPFECETNIYMGLMKNILQTMNIKPTNNLVVSDFIWLHWFENIYTTWGDNLQQKKDFLKKCEKNGQKIIWNVHNKQPHERENAEQVEVLMKLLTQSAYKIVIHSKPTTQVIKEFCENDEKILRKIIFVPHPHYAGAYGNLSRQNSLSDNKLKILFFGQIRPYKNIELMIKVFNELSFDDVELNICGKCDDKNYKRKLLKLIKTNKIKCDFRFIADNEVANLLSQNHILLLPYSLESSMNSGTIVLSFSYSRSVISPLIGMLEDINNKSSFFVYNYKTPEEHERELKGVLTRVREKYRGKYNELLKLGERCRETVLENNSYLRTTLALMEVFDIKPPQQITHCKPEISILVPVYNTGKYLPQCLDSILNQTFRDIEVICVNDASKDDSLRILNEYAQKDSRIIVIDKPQNEGLPQARRSALARSNGQYILSVDSDDWVKENICEELHTMAILGGYDIICCDYIEERKKHSFAVEAQILPEDKLQRIKCGSFGFGNAKVVWNKLIKRDIYEKVVFPIENNGEDCYISCQNFYYADKVGYYQKPLYHWRRTDKSLTLDKSLTQKRYEDRKANYEHIIEFCKEKFGGDLSIFEPELSVRMKWLEDERKNK